MFWNDLQGISNNEREVEELRNRFENVQNNSYKNVMLIEIPILLVIRVGLSDS